MYSYRATLIRTIDGDTIVFNVDLGFSIHYNCTVRLLGVDTPEIYGVKKDSEEYKAGQLASMFTKAWLEENGPEFILETKKVPEKYGRWLAIVKGKDNTILNESIKAFLSSSAEKQPSIEGE